MSMDDQLTSTCTTCGDGICFIEYTAWNGAEYDRLDGWWSHHHHPDDNHPAEPEPTDAMRALRAEA
jgi:hypothetical protein